MKARTQMAAMRTDSLKETKPSVTVTIKLPEQVSSFTYACTHACIDSYACTHACIDSYACTHACIDSYACTHACIDSYACTHACIDSYACTHACIDSYASTHACIDSIPSHESAGLQVTFVTYEFIGIYVSYHNCYMK